MVDVRIDANGIPKAEVFEQTTPVLHRSGVTAVDASDPASPASGVDAAGYRFVDFDVAVTLGGTEPLLEVAPLFYDATAAQWFRGPSTFITVTGRYRVRVDARGATTYLAVVGLSGMSPTLSLSAWSSRS